MSFVIPATATEGTRTWTVRRAWPRPDGATVELTAPRRDGSVAVRSGSWSPSPTGSTHGASASRMRLHVVGEDPELPGLERARGTIVSHRAGRRVVLRAVDASSYVKVVRPRKAEDVVLAHRRARPLAAGFALPELIRSADEMEGVVRFTALPGRTFHTIGADPAVTNADWHALWRSFADGWLRVLRTSNDDDAPRHTAADEADVIRTWARHAARAVEGAGPEVGKTATRLAIELASIDPGPGALAPAHRDLHDKQLLWDGGRPGLLDLDTACLADPALDLGNLRAHARWRADQGVWPQERALTAEAMIDEVADRAAVDTHRLTAYERAARFRIDCVYLFRPRWRDLAERRLAQW